MAVTDGMGLCNATQFSSIQDILGQYSEVAESVCQQASVSSQTPQNAVLQWTVAGLLATQQQQATTAVVLAGARYGEDVAFVLLSAFCVFCMQIGFALFAAGVVRTKSLSSILLKSFIDTAISAIFFYLVGYGLAFGSRQPTNGFIGDWDFALSATGAGDAPNAWHLFIWHWVFCAASTTILSGAVAERATLLSYVLYAAFYSSWVYPVIAHWNWSHQGWLGAYRKDPLLGIGSIDFAGSGVVHTIGGVSALVAAIFLGPRVGRFDPKSNVRDFTGGHNPPLYLLGTFLLWFGWYGFNPGSNLHIAGFSAATVVSRTAVTTTLGAAGGAVSGLLCVYWRTKTWDMLSTCSGLLAGLVAVTAGCSVIEPWAALLAGAVAGLCFQWGEELLIRLQIDDPAEAFAVHGIPGVWGVLFVGLLGKEEYITQVYGIAPGHHRMGIFYGGHGQLLLCQLIAVVSIVAWAAFWMTGFFWLLRRAGVLRVPLADEAVGIDMAAMGSGWGSDGAAHPRATVAFVGPFHERLSAGSLGGMLLPKMEAAAAARSGSGGPLLPGSGGGIALGGMFAAPSGGEFSTLRPNAPQVAVLTDLTPASL